MSQDYKQGAQGGGKELQDPSMSELEAALGIPLPLSFTDGETEAHTGQGRV